MSPLCRYCRADAEISHVYQPGDIPQLHTAAQPTMELGETCDRCGYTREHEEHEAVEVELETGPYETAILTIMSLVWLIIMLAIAAWALGLL